MTLETRHPRDDNEQQGGDGKLRRGAIRARFKEAAGGQDHEAKDG